MFDFGALMLMFSTFRATQFPPFDCLQMATDGGKYATDGVQEASYLYVKVLGRGAFGEAVLYRKTDVRFLELNLLSEAFSKAHKSI